MGRSAHTAVAIKDQLSLALAPTSHFSGTVKVPGSKSISNRVLLLAALAKGESSLFNILESDDTKYMKEALEKLGVSVSKDEYSAVQIKGIGGNLPNKKVEFFLGNSGTAMRSLTAALCLGVLCNKGEYILYGEPRMHERPIKDLVDALRSLGANIEYLENDGYPPLRIKPTGLNGGKVKIKGNISSQFLTALLIAAPYQNSLKTPMSHNPVKPEFLETTANSHKISSLEIEVEGELISKPYIYMTIRLMEKFGVKVENVNEEFKKFLIPKGTYKGQQNFQVEGDASSASYFYAGNFIAKGNVEVLGVNPDDFTLQGDIMFVNVLKEFSDAKKFQVASNLTIDATLFPDAAMTICPVACYAKGKTTITGIASWKVKETDRIKAMATELRKISATVETTENSITITPPEGDIQNATIETYKDHRMAMCFSLFSLNSPHKKGANITILDPACVNKTFPSYFEEFLRLTM
ncbi:3-phosphoshikimate 1-carboxyvinyltransferase [Fibrobacterales bacterium]|nr:3-phosphoshikimate 1-carboxyvinyltransferase [Fibrobacterales bacterium]